MNAMDEQNKNAVEAVSCNCGIALMNCDHKCVGCGFDPTEHKRRLKFGVWRSDEKGIRSLHFSKHPKKKTKRW